MSAEAVFSALLEASKVLASGTPIPGLGAAVAIAVSLMRTLIETKDLKSDCIQLAQHAAEITLAMYHQLHSAKYQPVDQQVIMIVDEHASTLREIEAYMAKTANKSLIRRVVLNGRMKADLAKYRGKLDAASRLFGAKALVNVMKQVSDLSNSTSSIYSRSSVALSPQDWAPQTLPVSFPPPRIQEIAPARAPEPRFVQTAAQPFEFASQRRASYAPSQHGPDTARLESFVLRASANVEREMARRDREMMRDAFSSIHRDGSHPDIAASHWQMLSTMDTLESGAGLPRIGY